MAAGSRSNDDPLSALPEARTPDPRTAPSLRWGVLGTGWIADRFVASCSSTPASRWSRSARARRTSARSFADRHGIAAAYGSYEELVADPDVDVVYVATPHNAHLPVALLSLGAGKHTLVEKPLGATAEEARQIAAAAEAAGVFCMEAMWTAFLPKFDVIRQLLDSGALGEPLSVVADFGEWFAEGHRILRPSWPAGRCWTWAPTWWPSPWTCSVRSTVLATGQWIPSGVLGQVGALLAHRGGDSLGAAHDAAQQHPDHRRDRRHRRDPGDRRAVLPARRLHDRRPRTERVSLRRGAIGHEALHYQAAEVARRIAAGETGSPLRPLAASIATLEVLDAIAEPAENDQ